MISGAAPKRAHFCLSNGIALDPERSGKREVHSTFDRKLVHAAIAFATVSIMAIATAPSAVAGSAERSTVEATAQPSLCAADPQRVQCRSSQALTKDAVRVQTLQTTASAASLPQLLNHTQMERLADILLGLTYFVLPVGFGVGLFLYDRHQAQRTAILQAQIQLLEKLWNQSPQA